MMAESYEISEIEKMKFTAAHWGTYKVRQKVGKNFKLIPFEQDKDPSDIGRGIESAIEGVRDTKAGN